MYPLGLVYAATIGPASTPPTVLVGALLIVISGGWIAWSVIRDPKVQPRGPRPAQGTVTLAERASEKPLEPN
jgi:hypothetical protein